MTYKTLIATHYDNAYALYLGDGEFGTCSTPKLMAHDMTDEIFWNYIEQESALSDEQINKMKENYKLIDVEVSRQVVCL